MPVKMVCSNCGYLFFDGADVLKVLDSRKRYYEYVKLSKTVYDSLPEYCPSCGKRLNKTNPEIEIEGIKVEMK